MELLITSIEHSKIAQLSVLLTQNSIESDFSSETLTIGDPFTSKPIYQYHLYVDAANLEKANSILIDSKLFEDELNENFETVDFDEDDDNEHGEEQVVQSISKGRNLGTLDDFDIPTYENIDGGYETGKKYLIIIGYVSAFLGGIFGILLGSNFLYLKSTKKDGTKKFIYDNSTRQHGLIMMLIGILMFFCLLIYKINNLLSL
jgi:hypothetical protein